MSLTLTVLAASGNANVNAANWSFGATSPTANCIVIAYIYEKFTGADPGVAPVISGLGLTWTQLDTFAFKPSSTGGRVTSFVGVGASPSGTAVSVTSGGSIVDGGYHLKQWAGAPSNTASAIGLHAAGGSSAATAQSAPALGGTPGSASVMDVGHVHANNNAVTWASGGASDATELNVGTRRIEAAHELSSDGTITASWSATTQVGWAAVEVKGLNLISLAGSVTPVGTLANKTSKLLSGSVTPTGTLAYVLAKTLSVAGSIVPTGGLTLLKTARMFLSGSVTPTGALATLLRHHLVTPLAEGVKTITSLASSGSALLTPISAVARTITSLVSRNPTLTQASDQHPLLTEKDETQG